MTIALIASTGITGQMASGGAASVTSSSINTTGANFVVAVVSYLSGSVPGNFTSDLGSEVAVVTAADRDYAGAGNHTGIYIWENPTVGSGATFTFNKGTGSLYLGFALAAFSGVATSSSTDQTNTNIAANSTSVAPGSITPSEDNELIITGWSMSGNAVGDVATNSSMTAVYAVGRNAGSGVLPAGLGYLIQTTAGAINPTWNWTSADYATGVIASFKQAAGGGSALGSYFYRQVAGMGA